MLMSSWPHELFKPDTYGDEIVKISLYSVVISVILFGCGGGGSGGFDPLSQPVPGPGTTDSNNEDETGPNPTQTAQEDMAADDPTGDTDVEDSLAESTEVISGSVTISLISATNTPGIGIPGSELERIDDIDHSGSGYVAFSGSYRLNDAGKYGVWSGLHRDVAPVIVTGDRIDGLPANVRFAGASNLSVAEDGSLALIANISGAGGGTAALFSTSTGSFEAIFRKGDAAPFLSNDTAEFEEFTDIQSSSAGQLIFTRAGGREVLYFKDVNGVVAVAGARADTLSIQPMTTTSCPISLFFLGRFRAFVTDDGSVVFLANLDRHMDSVDSNCPDKGIIRYKNGAYVPIITTNDTLPGTNTADVIDLSLLDVLSTGDVLFGVNAATPTGQSLNDRREAAFLSTPGSAPRLVALGGESLPLDFSNFLDTFLANTVVTIAGNGQVAMRAEAGRGATLLSGKARVVQPYPDLSNPGAIALEFVASSNSEVVPGYSASSYFSQLSWPTTDQTGHTVFWAEVSDAETGTKIAEGIWRHTAETGLVIGDCIRGDIHFQFTNYDTGRSRQYRQARYSS